MSQPQRRNVRLVLFAAFTQRSRGSLCRTACVLVCALGCSGATPAVLSPTHRHWLSGYVFGIWGKAELDVRNDCPRSAAANVRIGPTWTTLAATVLSLGLYTPREVRVQCKPEP